MTDLEEWRDITGYEGRYQVSSHGRVRSLGRTIQHSNRVHSTRLMALHWHTNDYWVVWLRKPGSHKKFFVHRLVALAFVSNPHNLPIVDHQDADRTNCHRLNLMWVTSSQNTRLHYSRKARLPVAPILSPVELEIDLADIPF